MILLSQANFGMMHIPKCAGSSLRAQFREGNELERDFLGTREVPGYGPMVGHHLPLAILQECYPDVIERLSRVRRYAIIREPGDRFRSAMSQWIRTALDKEPSQMRPSEIADEAFRVIDLLNGPGPRSRIESVVFFPQADYVFLNGDRFIDNLYRFEALDVLARDLAERHGLQFRPESAWNQTVTHRVPGLTSQIKSLPHVASTRPPRGAYVALRDVAVKVLARKGTPALTEGLATNRDVEAFLKHYYAQDFDLYAAIASKPVPA